MPLRRRRIPYQQLTEFEQDVLTKLLEGGFSFRDNTERLCRNVSTVHDCWEQWSKNGTVLKRPGSGLLRDTTEGYNHRIRRMAASHRAASAAKILAVFGTTVTQRIVGNMLLHEQLRARRLVAWTSNSKPLSSATPVVSNQSSLEVGVEICCVFWSKQVLSWCQ